MENKEQEIKAKYQKRLDEEIGGLEVFSREHKICTDKFNRLLETMQNSRESRAEKAALIECKRITNDLLNFLKKNNYTLNESEKRVLTAITGSGHNSLVKKSMAEDLAHKIKRRCGRENQLNLEKIRSRAEIVQLKSSGNKIASWFRLVKFSYNFNTITLFSHRITDSCLSVIRTKIHPCIVNIEASVRDILDNRYYLLSNLQYNALRQLVSLREPADAIMQLQRQPSYDPEYLSEQLDIFSKAYIAVTRNSETIESVIKTITEKIAKTHGLWGDLKTILDEPLQNNKPVAWTLHARMTKSILGMLLSYHTASRGIVVSTLGQIMHLMRADGRIESDKKNLTPKAAENESEKRMKLESDKSDDEEKLKDLSRIVKIYIKNGPVFEDMMFKQESGNMYKLWIEEHKKNPLVRIKRLVECFINYFVEDINNGSGFMLEYDGNEYKDFFSARDDLIRMTIQYNLVEFELVGTKLKDFTDRTLIADKSADNVIKTIMEMKSPKISGLNFIRNVLTDIGNRSYNLAVMLNEIILHYHKNREINYDNTMYNYNFFMNALLFEDIHLKSPALFQKNKISLSLFLEAACSLAFHIAKEVCHPGIDAILAEQHRLINDLDGDGHEDDAGQRLTGDRDIPGSDINIDDEENLGGMYVDSLTGLKTKDYLDDVALQRFYDKKGNYSGEPKRFLFMCEITGLEKYNDRYGHETGDRIVLTVAGAFYDRINAPGMHGDNLIIRYSGKELLGFLHQQNLVETVGLLREAVRHIAKVAIEHEGTAIGPIPVAAAVYEERKLTGFLDNFSAVSRILSSVAAKGTGVGFIRKENYAVTKKDLNQYGVIDEEIVGIAK